MFRPGLPTMRAVCLAIAAAIFALLLPSLTPGLTPDVAAQSQPAPDGYAHLLVITNFDNTEVSINGVSYPYEWIYGDSNGVLLPAGRTYEIVVATSPTARRTYRIRLNDGETRVLVADVENISSTGTVAAAAPPPPVETPQAEPAPTEAEEEETPVGYLGVSSSPRGIVHVDGVSTDQRTPARRIELEPGRHEVTVFYDEEGVMSEVKHVLIRSGVNTNVFFRMAREPQAGPE